MDQVSSITRSNTQPLYTPRDLNPKPTHKESKNEPTDKAVFQGPTRIWQVIVCQEASGYPDALLTAFLALKATRAPGGAIFSGTDEPILSLGTICSGCESHADPSWDFTNVTPWCSFNLSLIRAVSATPRGIPVVEAPVNNRSIVPADAFLERACQSITANPDHSPRKKSAELV